MTTTSESLVEIAKALSKFQGAMKSVPKGSTNPFFKSKYADLSSVTDAIKAPLSKYGLSYTQVVEPSDNNEVRVETILMHSSGEWLSCGILAVPVSKADAQGFGSALTYARRYGLSAAIGVAGEDDDGNAATKAAPVSVPANVLAQQNTEEQTFLKGLADDIKASGRNNEVALFDAYTKVKEGLDTDEQIALWAYFDSKQRSSIKRIGETRKAAEKATEMAGGI